MVVGGYAVGVHAQPRATKDIDIFIEMSQANAAAAYAALVAFGAPLREVSPEDFLKPDSVLRIGLPPVAADILQQIDGVTFAQAWERCEECLIDDEVTRGISRRRTLLRTNWRREGRRTWRTWRR